MARVHQRARGAPGKLLTAFCGWCRHRGWLLHAIPIPVGNGKTVRRQVFDQLEEVRDSPFGSEAAKAAAARQLAGPPLPLRMYHVARWWEELAAARPSGGMGIGTISHVDVQAWRDLMGTRPTRWEIECLLKGDRTFVAEVQRDDAAPDAYNPDLEIPRLVELVARLDEEDRIA